MYNSSKSFKSLTYSNTFTQTQCVILSAADKLFTLHLVLIIALIVIVNFARVHSKHSIGVSKYPGTIFSCLGGGGGVQAYNIGNFDYEIRVEGEGQDTSRLF